MKPEEATLRPTVRGRSQGERNSSSHVRHSTHCAAGDKCGRHAEGGRAARGALTIRRTLRRNQDLLAAALDSAAEPGMLLKRTR